jgi:hypothetical protein
MNLPRALLLTTTLSLGACATVTPVPGGRLVGTKDFVGTVGMELDGLAIGSSELVVGALPNLWGSGRFGVADGFDGGITLFPFGLELDGRGRLFADEESALAIGLGGTVRGALWDGFEYLSSQANLDLHYERGEIERAIVARLGPSFFVDERGEVAFGGRGAVGMRFGDTVGIVPSLGVSAFAAGSSKAIPVMAGLGVGFEFGRSRRRYTPEGRPEGKQDW